MSATATATTPKARPADTCRLTLEIGDSEYRVTPLDVRDFGAVRAFRLRRTHAEKDGKYPVYDVCQMIEFTTCDCPAGTYRDEPCKHVRALKACGLLVGPRRPPASRAAGDRVRDGFAAPSI